MTLNRYKIVVRTTRPGLLTGFTIYTEDGKSLGQIAVRVGRESLIEPGTVDWHRDQLSKQPGVTSVSIEPMVKESKLKGRGRRK